MATNIDDAHKQVHTCPTERRRLFISQDLSTGGLLLATWYGRDCEENPASSGLFYARRLEAGGIGVFRRVEYTLVT